MIELSLSGREYTWGNNLEHSTFEKLDRILCDVDWEEIYPLTNVTGVGRELSDHVPLFIFSKDLPRVEPMFKYENAWLLREGIEKIVIDNWHNNGHRGPNIDRW